MAKDTPTEKAKALIDENLRRVFTDIVEEPLPDRLVELLERLRQDGSPPTDPTQ